MYHNKYLSNIDFDNVYVTKYFKSIDEKRKRQGHHTLLPPKKIEMQYLIEPMTAYRGEKEYWHLLAHMCKTLLEIIVSVCFIILDHLLYVGLYIVAKHGKINYSQAGEHIVNIKVVSPFF